MKPTTYRPKPTRITVRLRRAHKRTIEAMALSNGMSFEMQLMTLVMGELR